MTTGVGGMDVGKVSDGAIEKAKTKGPKVDKGFLDLMKKAASTKSTGNKHLDMLKRANEASGATAAETADIGSADKKAKKEERAAIQGGPRQKDLVREKDLKRSPLKEFLDPKRSSIDLDTRQAQDKPKLFKEFLKRNVLNNVTRGKDTDSSVPYQHHMETKLETFFNPERGNGLPEDKHAHRPPREIGKQEDINLKIDPGPLFK